MVYGLISDIHANREAFEAVLAELAGVDAYLCLGDVVGYGPDPVACLQRLRELPGLACVAGNHDLAAVGRYDLEWFNPYARAAVEWTAEQLTPDDESYLGSLPLQSEAAGVTLVHGSLPEPMDYIIDPRAALVCFQAMPGRICFVGHTHVAEYYRQDGRRLLPEQLPLYQGGRVAFEAGRRYIVNIGSVGQPRDGNPAASCGLFDPESESVEVRRVGYDIAAVQRKMRKARLPEYLAERLTRGG
jgi:diadenosine tetraphosphatase ApaH/serine/threonine PP2A family protein phosphatase